MSRRTLWEQFVIGFALLGMLLALTGKKGCQENYFLGAQSTVATLTPTPTEDDGDGDDDDDDTITRTPTATATVTGTITNETDASPTAEPTEDPGETSASSILNELALLNKSEENEPKDKSDATGNQEHARAGADQNSSNWLGKAFSGGTEEEQEQVSQTIDTDGDGYADWLEDESGTDPKNPNDTPEPPRLTLDSRMKGIDSDIDGLPNSSEARNGTDKTIADTDGDGYLDGLEVLSGSNPKDQRSKPVDSDGDGASDELEIQRGLDPNQQDSDGDGLNDGLEIVLRTNGLDPDTDHDGILDGKEYELGADPAQSERR